MKNQTMGGLQNRIFSMEHDSQRTQKDCTDIVSGAVSLKPKKEKQDLPQVKLTNAKLNVYKYQKSFYRFGQFEKLTLSSKTKIPSHDQHK
jgi:hypothetical protein